MYLFILFACSAEFEANEFNEPTYVREHSMSSLDNVRNDPSIHQGSIDFTSEEAFESFCEDHTAVVGNVHIFGEDIHSLEGLSCLERVHGTLEVEFTKVSSLHGLESLSVVTKDVIVTRNPNLKTLEGLESLETINGNLDISYHVELQNLHGLESVIEIDGDVYLSGNPVLNNLDGLDSLEHVGGSMSIVDHDALESFDGLYSLEEVHGDLHIEHNANIRDLSGWETLESIQGSLYIHNNRSLTSFDGFTNVRAIEEVSVLYNQKLRDVAALVSVEEMEWAGMQFNGLGLCHNDQQGVLFLIKNNAQLWNNTVCQ